MLLEARFFSFKYRLAAGLRPDPLGELKRFPRPPSRNKGGLLLRGEGGKGREGGGGGKGETREGPTFSLVHATPLQQRIRVLAIACLVILIVVLCYDPASYIFTKTKPNMHIWLEVPIQAPKMGVLGTLDP